VSGTDLSADNAVYTNELMVSKSKLFVNIGIWGNKSSKVGYLKMMSQGIYW